jgi:hypothetical protein
VGTARQRCAGASVEWDEDGPRGRVSLAREGEATAEWVGNGPAGGRRVSLFSKFYFYFCIPFFEQLINLRC